jgi:hypothetical protein
VPEDAVVVVSGGVVSGGVVIVCYVI